MKKILFIALGVAMLLLAISVQPTKAQVYGGFESVDIVRNVPYVELDPTTDEAIAPVNFGLPPTWIMDLDDGYAFPAGIDIGFDFEFNGEVYRKVWICVNGFITFTPPPFVPSKVATGLFVGSVSYPKNVVAPFWGDHVYRNTSEKFQGYMPSRISYYTDVANGVFTVQWKNLNINDGTVRSSVANFQVKIYKSADPLAFQGDIEFAYGPVGGNTYTQETNVITRNATVGVKGEGDDYMNGLEYGQDPYLVRTSRQLTNLWPPSEGATDKRIRFFALSRFSIDEWWGDGDVDFSKAVGKKHFGMPQNRFVTVNDARLIMRSVVTGFKLDSVRKRAAYHGDVNHNGRYWYDNEGTRQDIPWRDMYYGSNLPTGVNSIKRIFFQVTEFDAAMIMHYMSARIPELPWLLDTIPQYGKINADDIASGLKTGTPVKVDENTYKMPVYLNGYYKGPIAAKFNVEGDIVNVENTGNEANQLMTDFNNNMVAIAGDGEYDAATPVCYVTIKSNNQNTKFTNVRFNDKQTGDVSATLLSAPENNAQQSLNCYPNPFSNFTSINVNVPQNGNYTLSIYDGMGNKVKTLVSGSLNAGTYSYNWFGTNEAGAKMQSGVYVYRLTGDNVTLSNKVVLNK